MIAWDSKGILVDSDCHETDIMDESVLGKSVRYNSDMSINGPCLCVLINRPRASRFAVVIKSGDHFASHIKLESSSCLRSFGKNIGYCLQIISWILWP